MRAAAMAAGSWQGGGWGGGWGDGGWGEGSDAPDWGGSEAAKEERFEAAKEEPEEEADVPMVDDDAGETAARVKAELAKSGAVKRERGERGGANRPSRMRYFSKKSGATMPASAPRPPPGEGHLRPEDRSVPWQRRWLLEKAVHTSKTAAVDFEKMKDMLFKWESIDNWKWCGVLRVKSVSRAPKRV